MNKKKQIRAAFRKSVFSRDGYKCKICGWSENIDELDPHHITDRNEMPNGGYVKENGITVCPDCHKKAECFHQGLPVEKGYMPDDLYCLIGSSKSLAVFVDSRSK